MRKMMLLAAMTALAALMLAATPAMANDFDRNDFCGFFDCNDFDEFCDGFDRDFFCDDRFDFNDGFDQDADSGDIDQSFTVNGGGGNSNQSVSIQAVANTGNAQNQIGIFQGPSLASTGTTSTGTISAMTSIGTTSAKACETSVMTWIGMVSATTSSTASTTLRRGATSSSRTAVPRSR
jgi:hypothetical protein